MLGKLVDDSDTVLGPLAEHRKDLTRLHRRTPGRPRRRPPRQGDALEQNFAKLPAFLRELGPAAEQLRRARRPDDAGGRRASPPQAPAVNRGHRGPRPVHACGHAGAQDARQRRRPAAAQTFPKIERPRRQLSNARQPAAAAGREPRQPLVELRRHRRHRGADAVHLLLHGLASTARTPRATTSARRLDVTSCVDAHDRSRRRLPVDVRRTAPMPRRPRPRRPRRRPRPPRRCSDYLLGRRRQVNRRRNNSIAGQPDPDRRRRGPRDDRRGVLVLQRQPRAAVRPDLRDQRRCCPTASGLIRGNEVRIGGHARRRRREDLALHQAPTARPARDCRARTSRRTSSPLPRDSVGADPAEVAAGAQVRRDHPRHDRRRYPAGATLPLAKGATRPVEIDDFFDMFDEPTRDASQRNLIECGNAFAGRGGDLNEALRRPRPAGHARRAGRAQPRRARRRGFDGLFPAFAQAANEAAPVAEQQGELFASLDQTFTALELGLRRPAAGDRARPEGARHRHARAARPGRLHARQRRALPPLPARLRGRWPPPRRNLAAAFRAGTHVAAALRRSSTAAWSPRCSALETFAADPRVHPGAAPPDRDGDAAEADPRVPHAGADHVQLLRRCSSATWPARCRRATRSAHSCASASVVAAAAAQQRGGPVRGAGQRPAGKDVSAIDDSFLHSNPYPNTAAPGQTQECEAGNEVYKPGSQQSSATSRATRGSTPSRPAPGEATPVRRNHSLGMSPLRAGLLVLVIVDRRLLLRLHQDGAVPPSLHGQGRREELQPAAPALAGAHRRRQRRRGRRRSAATTTRRWAMITMQIDDSGLPIHRDATLKIRPRLFLEGNFYVDLQAGHAVGAGRSTTAALIPVTQTATPVQLDQVLTALQSDTRGNAAAGAPRASATRSTRSRPPPTTPSRIPSVRGLTGGQALNKTLETSPQSLRGTAQVTDRLLGTEPHDLAKTIARPRPTLPRPGRPRERPRRLRRRLQHHDGHHRRPRRRALARPSTSWGRPRSAADGLRASSNAALPRRRASSRAT